MVALLAPDAVSVQECRSDFGPHAEPESHERVRVPGLVKGFYYNIRLRCNGVSVFKVYGTGKLDACSWLAKAWRKGHKF